MKPYLICPGERPAVAFLAQTAPLVNVPLLGETLISYWMDWLAMQRATEVVLLATDRPEQVRDIVGEGTRWGLRVEIWPELREPKPADISRRLSASEPSAILTENNIFVVDHLPGFPEQRLFTSYADWFGAVLHWMPHASNSARVGFREINPGVWRGLRTQIAPTAQLHAPCWIGENVRVGAHAIIGPRAVLENRSVVDSAAEISDSIVAPDTFVGTLTRVHGSLAWGNTLINWRTSSCTAVPDPFLLSLLGARGGAGLLRE